VSSLLFVAANPEETAGLRREMELQGHSVAVAPGSFYALTLLERNAPDVLVAWPDVGEPSAEELCAILRQDPAMERVRLVLVQPDGAAPVSTPGAFVIAAGLPAALSAALGRLLPPSPPAGKAEEDPARTQPLPEVGGLVGRLDTIQLAHLVQALAELKRTGCLRVMFFSAESQAYFDRGRLVHATFGSLKGEEALLESLLEAETQPGALFSFDRYDAERIGIVPVTVTARLESILLDASALLDRRRDPDAGDETRHEVTEDGPEHR
jgi:hypothetical protein